MDSFIPDIYQKSIYTIDYKQLKKTGVKCLLFDLNDTIAPVSMPVPDKKLKDLFAYLEGLSFKIIILSNATKSRVEPFKEKLNVDSAFKSGKPSLQKYEKVLDLYRFQVHEIASVGDQLFPDIYCANKMGFRSILVNPISKKKSGNLDRFLFQKLKNKGILEKGVYYE